MDPLNNWKKPVIFLLRIFIALDLAALLLIFLHVQFQISLIPFPPDTKLNNPLAALLSAFFLLGVINANFREKWLGRIQSLTTGVPQRYYLFGALLAIEVFLQIMWFRYPEDFLWNLNAEQGYGTHFSTIQLFILGVIVLIIARHEDSNEGSKNTRWPWILVASLYFYIALDDCIGIHENFIFWFRNVFPDASTFHFIHEWLWFYAPFILLVVGFLIHFFFKKFKKEPLVMLVMFVGLVFWVSVILLEGLSKSVVDPIGLDESRLLIAIEEGSEMIGATLFLFGFSQHLITRKSPRLQETGSSENQITAA